MEESYMKAMLSAAAGLAMGLFAAFSPAQAAPVALVGNETTVTVTAPLGTLGLSGAAFGTATLSVVDGLPAFAFPITGGTIDSATSDALIEHNGSGVTLTGAGTSATVGNFLIDTLAMTVFGDLIDAATGTSIASGLELFGFGAETARPGVQLLITSTLAGALSDTFGAPDLTGVEFGYAVPDIAAVPVPAAGLLLLGGLGMMGALRARCRAA
jgi:hypothetical protein